MKKSNILGNLVFIGFVFIFVLFLNVLVIWDIFSSNPRFNSNDQTVLCVLAAVLCGLFGGLWCSYLKLWKMANPENPSLVKTLQRFLPSYSIRFWEGRKGLEALARRDCETATTLWRSLADQGDPEAKYRLGLLYSDGECVDKNVRAAARLMADAARQVHFAAVRWLKRSARNGNAHAQFELGMMYLAGDGVGQSRRRSRKLLSAAAEQRHSEAQVEWGRLNVAGLLYTRFQRFRLGIGPVNASKAFRLFDKAARSGNPRGMLYLGLSYETGEGTIKDGAKAFELVSKAAESRVLIGQLNLARYYWMGEVTETNKALATKWFELAKGNVDEKTDTDTQIILAQSYINGWCCEPDLVQGYYWTAISCRHIPVIKRAGLKFLEKKMDKHQIRQAKALL